MNNHSLRYAVSGACYVCMQIVRDDVLVSHICVVTVPDIRRFVECREQTY